MSANLVRCGTILNGSPIREAPIKDGDEVVIKGMDVSGAATPEAARLTNLRLRAILEMATALQGPHTLDEILNLILERIFPILQPERAYVAVPDGSPGAASAIQ